MASVYRTRMKRNLKKCAASCARPAIQYVLQDDQWRVRAGKAGSATHMVDTIIVGMIRRGMTSKINRDNNHAVGLPK